MPINIASLEAYTPDHFSYSHPVPDLYDKRFIITAKWFDWLTIATVLTYRSDELTVDPLSSKLTDNILQLHHVDKQWNYLYFKSEYLKLESPLNRTRLNFKFRGHVHVHLMVKVIFQRSLKTNVH